MKFGLPSGQEKPVEIDGKYHQNCLSWVAFVEIDGHAGSENIPYAMDRANVGLVQKMTFAYNQTLREATTDFRGVRQLDNVAFRSAVVLRIVQQK